VTLGTFFRAGDSFYELSGRNDSDRSFFHQHNNWQKFQKREGADAFYSAPSSFEVCVCVRACVYVSATHDEEF
jgi:hypothetical protein